MKRYIIRENKRTIVIKDGKFQRILTPGIYTFWGSLFHYAFENHTINVPKIQSEYIDSIVKQYPEKVQDQVVTVNPGSNQVGIVYLNGKIIDLLSPNSLGYYWKDSGEISSRYIDLNESLYVPSELMPQFKEFFPLSSTVQYSQMLSLYSILEGHVGIVYVNNVYKETLQEGLYYIWNAGGAVRVHIIDTRLSELEVTGQEVLTKDKVTVRANVVLYYQVKDPIKALTEVSDYSTFMYKQLQFALRKAVEAKTLDELLDTKSSLDEELSAAVSDAVKPYGVVIDRVGIKDIILPGEMREILNKVILAEKEAQANVIKRREETAATRSLLNTAKLMDDHPMLMRMKELESIENIMEKVDNLSVYGGLDNLIGKLVGSDRK